MSLLTKLRSITLIETKASRRIMVRRPELEKIRDLAVKQGLVKLLEDGFFSICQLYKLLAASHITPDGEIHRILAPLHCVNWSDMDPDLRL